MMDVTDSTMVTQAQMAVNFRGAATSPDATASSGMPANLDGIKKVAQNFESVFLSQMFGEMFKGVGSDSLFGGGQGEEMFRSLLIDEYGKSVVKRGGLGITDAVMRTLIRQQEKKS